MRLSRHASLIVALRDPFLRLKPVSKLLEQNAEVERSRSRAVEIAESVYGELVEYHGWMEKRRGLLWYEIVPDAPGTIRGVASPLPEMSAERSRLREIWTKIQAFEQDLIRSTPTEFEELGRRILEWYGIKKSVSTRISADGGFDFYGEGCLGELVGRSTNEWTVVDECKVLFLGQAKKYDKLVVGTPELRDLIGSVALLHRESYRDRFGYSEMNWSLLQPRILMFITTSRFSAEALILAEEAGIVLADRDQIAKIYYSHLDLRGEN